MNFTCMECFRQVGGDIAFLQSVLDSISVPDVLIVDDEKNDRELLKHELKRFRCHVHEANAGDVALRMIAEGHFDLVLLDVVMPELDALDVISAARRLQLGSSGFVLVTGSVDSKRICACLDAGGFMAFPKPLTHEQLRIFLRPRPQ